MNARRPNQRFSIKTLNLVAAMVTALLTLNLAVPTALATIVGSKHDFQGSGWTNGEICIACHTPHDANASLTEAPLWNHTLTTVSYTVYSSSTMDVVVNQPGTASKLCLSCHDGTLALDSFGGAMGGGSKMPGTPGTPGSPDLGIDLRDDHPIGINWDHQVIGATPDCNVCHQMAPWAYIGMPIFSGNIECPTCHDVHNTELPGEAKLLRKTLTGSKLCLDCHQDKL